jgi:hypothetical protein
MTSSSLHKNHWESYEYVILVILALLAAWLRFHHLGALGLYGDEDHSYLAVKGVLQTGWPEMPSGMLYPRGLLYTYLAAGSALVFGLSEAALRFPSALFSLMTLVLLYSIARDVRGPHEALVAAFLFSVSTWDIEMARFARMYEMFLFFSLLAAYAFYRGFLIGERRWRHAVPILFVLACSLHALGVFLLVLFAGVFFVRVPEGFARWKSLVYGGVIGVADAILSKLENLPYAHAFNNIVLQPGNTDDAIKLPQMGLVRATLSSWEGIGLFSAMMVLALVFAITAKRMSAEEMTRARWLLIGGIIIAAFTHTYVVMMLLIGYRIYSSGRGLATIFDRAFWPYYGFVFLSAIIWTVMIGGVFHGLTFKASLENLFDYPFMNLRVLKGAFPLMTFLVVLGSILLFHEASTQGYSQSSVFLFVSFVGPLLAIGFIRSWPWMGYLYMVYPFFLIIYASIVVKGCQWIVHRLCADCMTISRPISAMTTATSLAAAVILSNGHSYAEARLIAERTYATPVQDVEIFEYFRHPDHKSAALYVRDHRQADDAVIAMDFLSAAYLGQINYLLRTEGYLVPGLQLKNEIFLGCPILHDLGGLRRVIEARGRGNVWLITSQEHWGPHLKEPILSQEVVTFLEENRAQVIFVGGDEVTRVYKWSPSLPGAKQS